MLSGPFQFDAMFTEKFFTIEKEVKDLVYQPTFPALTQIDRSPEALAIQPDITAKTLGEFFDSAKGHIFKKALADNVDKLIAWANHHGIATQGLSKFKDFYLAYNGDKPEKNTEYFKLYETGVPLLEAINKLLDSNSISLSVCQQAIAHLSETMLKCGPGTYTNIIDVYLKLSASNIKVKLMLARQELAREFVRKEIKKSFDDEKAPPILEVHYINHVLNTYSEFLSVPFVEDPNIKKYCQPYILEHLTQHFKSQLNGFVNSLTSEAVIEALIFNLPLDECLSEMNAAAKMESLLILINCEIENINTKGDYRLDNIEAMSEEDITLALDKLKKVFQDLIINRFTLDLKKHETAGDIILRKLNSIHNNLTLNQRIPTLLYGQAESIKHFTDELEIFGTEDSFYDHEEVIVSKDNYVTSETGWKANGILFSSLQHRLLANGFLTNDSSLNILEIPELNIVISYYKDKSIKLASVHLTKTKGYEKKHQPFLVYCIEQFANGFDTKKHKALINFLREENCENKVLFATEIGKFLFSSKYRNSKAEKKQKTLDHLLSAISEIINPIGAPKPGHVWWLNISSIHDIALILENFPTAVIPKLFSLLNSEAILEMCVSGKRYDLVIQYGDAIAVYSNLESMIKINRISRCFDDAGNSPLMQAILANNFDLVELILANEKMTELWKDVQNIVGLDPISLVIKKNIERLLEILLKNKIYDVNSSTINTQTLLDYAITNKSMDCVSVLLEYGAHITNKILHPTISQNDMVLLSLLLNYYKPENNPFTDISPLIYAVKRKNNEAVKIILQSDKFNVDVATQHGNTPLHLAAFSGYKEITKLLLSAKANPDLINSDKKTPFTLALENDHWEIVALLLAEKINVNQLIEDKYSPLTFAARNGLYEMTKVLLASGMFDVHATDSYFLPPIQYAVESGNADLVALLLENGADITACDFKSILHFVCDHKDNDKLTTILLNTNLFDVNEIYLGKTPIQWAIHCEAYKTVKALLCDPEIEPNHNIFDGTPLLHTLIKNDAPFELIEALLTSDKIDPSLQDTEGKNALELAITYELDPSSIQALIDHPKINLNQELMKVPMLAINSRNFTIIDTIFCSDKLDTPNLSLLLITEKEVKNYIPELTQVLTILLISKKHQQSIYQQASEIIFSRIENACEHLSTLTVLTSVMRPLEKLIKNGKNVIDLAIEHSQTGLLKILMSGPESSYVKQYLLTKLIQAADQNDMKSLITIILHVDFLKTMLPSGVNVITHLLKMNSFTTLKVLLQNFSLTNQEKQIIYKKLIQAVIDQDIELVKSLLAIGCDAFIKPGMEMTFTFPIVYFAANKNQLEMVELLLKHGADVNKLSNKNSALHNAISLNNLNLVTLLLDYNADLTQKNYEDLTPFEYSLELDNTVILSYLVNTSPICREQAIQKLFSGHYAATKLFDHGIATTVRNANGETFLQSLIHAKNFKQIEALLKEPKYGSDFVKQAQEYLPSITDLSTILSLTNMGIPVSPEQIKSLLLKQIALGNFANLELIRGHAGFISEMRTILHETITTNNIPLIKQLLGIEFIRELSLMATFDFALAQKDINLMQILIFEAPDTVSNALFNAVKQGDIDTLDSLLKAGVSANMVSGANLPLLNMAISKKNIHIVKLLLAAGADPNQNKGWEAMETIARSLEHDQIFNLLRVYREARPLAEPQGTSRHSAIQRLIAIAENNSTDKFNEAFYLFLDIDSLAQRFSAAVHSDKEDEIQETMRDVIEVAYELFKENKLDECRKNLSAALKYHNLKAPGAMSMFFKNDLQSSKSEKRFSPRISPR